MGLAIVTLSSQGAMLAHGLAKRFPNAQMFVHETVDAAWEGERFTSIMEVVGRIFGRFSGLVFIAPCGVAVRAVAPHLEHKTADPAVVVVDVGGRWAVSLLSGHERGANDLAVRVANALCAEPVISTTTEALKDLIVGIGCRRGADSTAIVAAVKQVLDEADLDLRRVRFLSTADVKADEEGLIKAAGDLAIPLRFIASTEIRNSARGFEHSDFVQAKVDLPAVAEPCALLAGRRTTLLVPKKIFDGVTVAVARESFLWSE